MTIRKITVFAVAAVAASAFSFMMPTAASAQAHAKGGYDCLGNGTLGCKVTNRGKIIPVDGAVRVSEPQGTRARGLRGIRAQARAFGPGYFSGVYVNGVYQGNDPDPNIRLQMRRDPSWEW